MTYAELRTGLTWEEVRLGLWSVSDDPKEWRYKRRGSVLGKWHQFKQEAWRHHLVECRGARTKERRIDLQRWLKKHLPSWNDTEGAGF